MQIYRHDVTHVYCLLFRRSALIARGPVFGKGHQCNKQPTIVAGGRGRIDCVELLCLFHGQTCSASSKTRWTVLCSSTAIADRSLHSDDTKWLGLWTCTTNSLHAFHVTIIYVFVCWSFWIHCLLVSRTNIFCFVWLLGLVGVMLILRGDCILCTLNGGAWYCVMCSCFWPQCLTPSMPVSLEFSDIQSPTFFRPRYTVGQECV